ncbi:MAG: type II toxin-antitoxin system RelE/ParE family toxin [bacterium]|nr:type II toxin-antitoxin system RelE/ParE family toxin [bacterium]
MQSKIFYKSSVEKDLRGISPQGRTRILEEIEDYLSKNLKEGKTLKGKFKELRSLRVGDYRIIYTLIKEGVLILKVGHRREVYK